MKSTRYRDDGAIVLLAIIPVRVLGADAPSKKVNIPRSVVAASRGMDMPGILKQDAARVIAAAT